MSSDSLKKKSAGIPQDWHPYTVWQQRIRDAEAQEVAHKENVTGSWRTDTVWENLIKG